jgi:hypothetical protein
VNQNLRSRWVLANALGFTVGGALAGGVARALEEPHVGITSSGRGALVSAMVAVVALGMFGAVIGLAQWLALRRCLARVAWWPPATAAGWAAAGAIAGRLSGAIGGAVTDVGGDFGTWGFAAAAVAGAVAIAFLPGALQSLVLGKDARSWIPVHAVGFAVGWAVAAPAILLAGNVLGLGLPSARSVGDRRLGGRAREWCNHGGAPGSLGRVAIE